MKFNLGDELNRSRKAVSQLEKTLADPPVFMRPVIVLDNEVQIFVVSPTTSSAPTPAGPIPGPGLRQ